MRTLGISDADMEKGQMRLEANVSMRTLEMEERGELPKYKVEIKNINSFRFMERAVKAEITRQSELLENGQTPAQENRGYDEDKDITVSQRDKEEAHDYRYFPEPDLPPLKFTPAQIATIKDGLFELPQARRERFRKQYNLPDNDIDVFTVNKPLGDYFEHVASELLSFDKLGHLEKPEPEHQEKLFKLASNYTITELKRMVETVAADPSDTKVTPEIFADLIVRVFHGQISSSGAQTVLKEMYETGFSPGQIIKEKDLEQISNAGELDMVVDKIIANNSQAVEDYKKGKEASLKFLIGMVMRESGGKANPQVVEEILRNKLK